MTRCSTFLFVYSDLRQSVETTGSLDRLLNKLSTTVPQVGSEAVGGLCYMSLHTSMGNKPLMQFNVTLAPCWDRKGVSKTKNSSYRVGKHRKPSTPRPAPNRALFSLTSLVSDLGTKQYERSPTPRHRFAIWARLRSRGSHPKVIDYSTCSAVWGQLGSASGCIRWFGLH